MQFSQSTSATNSKTIESYVLIFLEFLQSSERKPLTSIVFGFQMLRYSNPVVHYFFPVQNFLDVLENSHLI